MHPGIDAVRQYLRERHPDLGELRPDQELIDSRILDSLAMVEFVVMLADLTGGRVDLESVTRDDLRDLHAIERRFFLEDGHRDEDA